MKIKILSILTVLAIAFSLSGCFKAEGPILNTAVPSPSNLDVALKKSTLKASWDYTSDVPVNNFVVQLATDQDFNALLANDTLSADSRDISYDSIGYNTDYYFRIKVTVDNVAKNSPFQVQHLKLESILQDVGKGDVTGTSVKLNWSTPADGSVTDIVLIPQDSLPMDPVHLSDDDITNQTITINNLTSATTYTAIIYDGDVRKGVVTFTTVDTSAEITINKGEKTYTSLQKAIDDAAAGDVIYIKGLYDFSASGAVNIDKSLTIRAYEDAQDKPMITSDIFKLSGDVGNFTLMGLKLIGTGLQTLSVSDVVGEANVSFIDCDISGPGAGLMYASSSATTASYGITVDNCLIHDFGASGGDFIDFRAGTLTGLHITNSSFWNVARSFLRIDDTVDYTGKEDGLIENCTIDNVCTQRFIYVRSTPTIFHLNKCILTNRQSSTDNAVFPHIFADSDDTYGTNSDKFLQYFFGGTTNIVHEDPQYADAANGDFTLGNADLISKKWGDPRWLP